MRPKRILAIFLRQLYLFQGNTPRIVQTFVWVTVDITLWGFISTYLAGVAGGGASFAIAFLGGVLLWNFLIQVMQGTAMAFLEDVWSRNFLNFFASPLRMPEYLTGLVLTGVLRSVVTLAAMLILATLVFGFPVFFYGVSLAMFLFILFLFGIALGIVGVSIVLRWGPSAEWFVWPIPAIFSLFVGVIYPLSTLPRWMQAVGHLLPPSYVFEGVRAIVQGGTFSIPTFLWGVGLALVHIALAYGIFLTVYRKAIRIGLIARYSAESVV